MKRNLVCAAAICLIWLVWIGFAEAEFWIALPNQTPQVLYDRDSIHYPNTTVYDLGLFTAERPDKDVIRVWTKVETKDQGTHRVLYELKFSSKVYKTVYAVDQSGNPLSPFDASYKPISPGSMESELFTWTRGWVRPESIKTDAVNWATGTLKP